MHSITPTDRRFTITLGEPEMVLDDRALGLRAFPDGRLALVRTRPTCRVLCAAGTGSVLLEGPAMGRFTHARTVLEPGPPGSYDNGYAGINGAEWMPDGRLAAVYHAEDQESMRSVGSGIPGFYCSLGLAISADEGVTFAKQGQILTGERTKAPGARADQGVGEPCLLRVGGYIYMYYTSHERLRGRTVDICLARCRLPDLARPTEWRKYSDGGFSQPGLGGRDTPVLTDGAPDVDAVFPQVTYLTAVRRYLMIYCLNAWRENHEMVRSGLYAAFSTDGVRWPLSTRYGFWPVRTIVREGREVVWHPTYVPDAPGALAGWLYYSYSPRWGWTPPAKGHHMMRRRLAIGQG